MRKPRNRAMKVAWGGVVLCSLLAGCGPRPAAPDAEAPILGAPTDDPRLDAWFAELAAAKDDMVAADIAKRIWGRWLRPESATVEVLLQRSLEATLQQDAPRARELLDHVTALEPEFAEGWHRRALLRYREDDVAGALHDLNRVLELEPRHFSALSSLATIFEALGKPQEALGLYQDALKLHPFFEPAKAGRDRLAAQLDGRPA